VKSMSIGQGFEGD